MVGTNTTLSAGINYNQVAVDIDDIIFAGRNKNYGAYLLRKKYGKNIIIALTIGVSMACALVGANYFSNLMAGTETKPDIIVHPITLQPLPADTKPLPVLPQISTPPPPRVQSIRYMAPEIMEDEKVKNEEITPDQDELRNKQISSVTQVGEESKTDIIIENDERKGSVIGEEKEEIYYKVEINPSFPGGMEAFSKYLSKNLKYPRAARNANIHGKVYVSFVVNSEGKISDIKILKGPGFGCDEEAVRVISGMPLWKPGKQGGRFVSCRYNIVINFSLNAD